MTKTITRLAAVFTAAIMLITLVSCSNDSLKDSDIVMTVDGMEVPYSVIRYFIYNYKSENNVLDEDLSDGSDDNGSLAEDILSYSVDSVKSLYSVLSLAEKYDIDPFGDVIQAMVDTEYESESAAYDSKKEFKKYLSSNGLCEESFRILLLSSICADEIYYAMVKSGDISTDEAYIRSVIESDEFVRVLHILVVPKSASAEDDAAAKEKAEEAHARAVAGEDFMTLVKNYGGDTYMYGNSDGYYIMKGVWQREFENVAFSLDIGEISDVFYTSSGYSILLRLEKDSDYIEKNFDSLCDDYADAVYNLAIDEHTAEIEMTETELFDMISVANVK